MSHYCRSDDVLELGNLRFLETILNDLFDFLKKTQYLITLFLLHHPQKKKISLDPVVSSGHNLYNTVFQNYIMLLNFSEEINPFCSI